jgi:predicted dehydrogenase
VTVLIVGCGRIAGGFDEGRTTSDGPVTHAGAYSRDGRFCLAACVEPIGDRRRQFMQTWNIPTGYASMDEALEASAAVDVISLCSPTAYHAGDLEAALRMRPKLVFCEKPVTQTAAETARLQQACQDHGVLLAVNHTRRWDPAVQRLRAEMAEGRWGQLRSVIAVYNKGILNNGSHMLDLLDLLFGPIRVLDAGTPVLDYSMDDPSIPGRLETAEGAPISLVCGHSADYSCFELQLVLSEGVVTMENGGLQWRERRAQASDVFTGYRTLGTDTRRPGEYESAMLAAVANIHDAVAHGAPLASPGASALIAQRLCEQMVTR